MDAPVLQLAAEVLRSDDTGASIRFVLLVSGEERTATGPIWVDKGQQAILVVPYGDQP
jgi:hypothetical protein